MKAIIGGPNMVISDDDLGSISAANPGWQIERSDDGALLVSPTSTNGGAKSGEAFAQLHAYAKRYGGRAYDSNTGFKTPAGGIVSPDAAWVRAERVAQYLENSGYWQMMPDVVIEVSSESDTWLTVTGKIDKYARDGAAYAIAIDPSTQNAYERGDPPEGLVLDIAAISDA